MLRQRRPPALCGTVEAPITAMLRGFAKRSSGCVTSRRSPALKARRALLGKRPRPLLGVLGLVDERGHRRVVAQRLLRVLVKPAPREFLRDLHSDRSVVADPCSQLGG